jgi:hypothetical protein
MPLDQMRFGPASRPTSFGSYGSTQALAPAKNPRDLAPDAGLKQNESWRRIQAHWILTSNPTELGPHTGPKGNWFYVRSTKESYSKLGSNLVFLFSFLWNSSYEIWYKFNLSFASLDSTSFLRKFQSWIN